MSIPDYISPIVGYRVWTWGTTGLKSLCGERWKPSQSLAARCRASTVVGPISAKCTDADFVPRNTSIFYDAVAPQMTKNQDAAVKALYATSTPEFWIAAAHANGIFDRDSEFASYAAAEQADLAKKLRHQESSSGEFAHEVEIGVGLYVAFVALLCACSLSIRRFSACRESA